MRKNFLAGNPFVWAFLLVTSSLIGSGETIENTPQIIPVGSRNPILQQGLSLEEEEDGLDIEGEERIKHGALYYTTHSSAVHTMFPMTQSDRIKLNDGTIWFVSPQDRWKLSTWVTSDTVLILPNQKCCASYCYRYTLYNQEKYAYVDVNLCDVEYLPWDVTYYGNRRWIIDINYFANYFTLNDGSRWDVPMSDSYILGTWEKRDIVTIGINEESGSLLRTNILININKNPCDYIRANCVN